MIQERRAAFNLQRYTHGGVFNFQAFTEHLAALTIEGSHETVPFTLELQPDGRVINPALDQRDISEHYSEDTDLDRLEKRAGLQSKEVLLRTPTGTATVWISPSAGPLQYETGRVVFGISSDEDGILKLRSFGKSVSWDYEYYLPIARNLMRYSPYDYSDIVGTEELRGIQIIIPPIEGIKALDLLEKNIPFSHEVWQAIRAGLVEQKRDNIKQDAQIIAKALSHQLAQANADLIEIGARAELMMMQLGYHLDPEECGELNIDILGRIYSYAHMQILEGGGSTKEDGQYVKRCPYCKRDIERKIKAGFECACGEVYRAVC
jgi:hypothetical protein